VVRVPRDWPGETVVVVATGPSLTVDDVAYCRWKAKVIVINNAHELAPWADALYGCDAKWWRWHRGVPSFTGPKWSMDHSAWHGLKVQYPDVQLLRNTGSNGLERDPTGLRNGRNSGSQAINLAYHYGAKRIVMIGYDMQARGGKTHWFGDHPNKQKSPYDQFRRAFETLVKPLAKSGIEIVNCSRNSVLTAFPKAELRDVLKAKAVAA
jgi:hypothetical protein